MTRRCLSYPCPNLVPSGRCAVHQQQANRRHNRTHAKGGIYAGGWERVSKTLREAFPACVVCASTLRVSVDHTTGWTVCARHHWTEANGGVAAAMRAFRA